MVRLQVKDWREVPHQNKRKLFDYILRNRTFMEAFNVIAGAFALVFQLNEWLRRVRISLSVGLKARMSVGESVGFVGGTGLALGVIGLLLLKETCGIYAFLKPKDVYRMAYCLRESDKEDVVDASRTLRRCEVGDDLDEGM
nr:hypothetical protein CFP56_36785 [Quercus suber]